MKRKKSDPGFEDFFRRTMKLVTAKQMQSLDRVAIEKHGIPSLTLMERAGTSVADAAHDLARGRKGSVVVVCGRGNNGGDGLVAARLLIEKGLDVVVFLLSGSSELSPDARANWERLVPLTTHLFDKIGPNELRMHHPTIAGASVIVDAVFGTGLSRKITGPATEVIEYINAVRRPIIAVDIPSGLSSDAGIPLGASVRAHKTLTFGLPKIGLYTGEASEFAGDIEVVDIGIPREEIDSIDSHFRLTDPEELKGLLSKRHPEAHKGNFGHVAVIAGSGGKLGAGYLACMAAFRVGAGLLTYFLPGSSFEKFDARYSEIMCEPIPDKGRAHFHPEGIKDCVAKLANKTVIALGPGIGTHDETKAFVEELMKASSLPMVIDADGINDLSASQVRTRTAPTILTPHPKEFARLVGIKTGDVQRQRLKLALKLAMDNKTFVALKGHNTVIAAPNGRAYINPTGNPAMATAGMGDALTGAIAGLIAQGIDPFMAAVAATYIHGRAGDMAAAEIGDRGIVTSDVIKRFPTVIRELTEDEGK